MGKPNVIAILLLILCSCQHEETTNAMREYKVEDKSDVGQTQVLTLGTFHMAFHNRDVSKTTKDEQIDVLDSKYQREIEDIVTKLASFKPTRIAIEIDPERQNEYDSLYTAYLNGNYELERSETQQIGFRLAKKMNLKSLDCVNDWEFHYENVHELLVDTSARKPFLDFFYNHPDTSLQTGRAKDHIFKEQGILAELRRLNDERVLKADFGDYLIGVFKYETEANKNFGVDFVTGWWFNRNLKIFRNIQRLDLTPQDRILVIYGSGHMNILNPIFDASPEFKLLDVNEYLD